MLKKFVLPLALIAVLSLVSLCCNLLIPAPTPTAVPNEAPAQASTPTEVAAPEQVPTLTAEASLETPSMPATEQAPTPAAWPTPGAAQPAVPVSGHPRLWLTAADLPRLRSWAASSNPLYADGLMVVAEAAKAAMDEGHVPGGDTGGNVYEEYPCEAYAELFAFMALVGPEADRADYTQRAHALLMHVIAAAAQGAAAGQPFRDPEFSISDRSRYYGEGFALTVDWIYPALSAQDKAAIRTVFLRWADENQHSTYTSYNHPEPIGVVNDPALVSDKDAVRFAVNNYYTAHMRNLGLMAMALDAADDPGGTLAAYLRPATGAWLYVIDDALRHDAAGGFGPEGFEYYPQTLSFALHFLLALHTAGQDDPARWGPQVVLNNNPFWNDLVTAYLHSLSPAPINSPDEGPRYLPAAYGDSQRYYLSDWIGPLGTLGVYDQAVPNPARLNALRWLETNTPTGGAAALVDRARGANTFAETLLYFMLFDPQAAPATDPRPATPLSFLAPGLGRLLARTSWSADAAWFQYSLSWNRVDHQTASGNNFGFYRHGEWLTKERTGYANIAEGISSSEFENTLCLENSPPAHDDWRQDLWQRGSQWNIVASGDPQRLAYSLADHYSYALGDATALYNSTSEGSTDIVHASRSILWLKPDHIVVYDRAQSKTAGRFKRFWLQLPQPATINGQQARLATTAGQQLFITAVLPADAQLTAVNTVDQVIQDTVAQDEPMGYRLKVEAPGGPADVRFLNVLQGADAGATADPVTLIQSTGGTPYAGAVVGQVAVLFPVSLNVAFTGLTYAAPAATTAHLITGLTPNHDYAVKLATQGAQVQVTVTDGTGYHTDAGGVLVVGDLPAPASH